MGKKGRFKHFDASQRRRLEVGLNAGDSLSEIARRLGVATSTVSREVKRNRRCDGNLCDIKGCGRLCRVRRGHASGTARTMCYSFHSTQRRGEQLWPLTASRS